MNILILFFLLVYTFIGLYYRMEMEELVVMNGEIGFKTNTILWKNTIK
jgi:hypothetical protein